MPGKKRTRTSKNSIDKRITAKLYRVPKEIRRKTNKNKESRGPSPNGCPICLEPLTKKNLAILDCGHKFHFRCILKDVTKDRSNKLCPICREPVDSTLPNPPEDPAPSQSNTPPPPANPRLNERQLSQLESVRDRYGNSAYLDDSGIFGYPLYLYNANGEDIGFYIDFEDDYPYI